MSGANATVYSSSDGANWAAGTATASGAGGGQIAYHAVSDSFFLMATNDKLLQSSNAAGSYAFGATDLVAGASAPVHLSLGHHAAFVIDPADATHLVVGEAAGGEGILVSSDGGGSWGVSNDGLFAQSVDFAFKTPSGYRYAANRSGFVYFGGAALDAPWTRLFRPADSVREATTALAYDSAADKHVVVAQSNLVDVSVLRAVADATATGDDMAPFAHGAWTTLTYPDAGKAPVVALLVDGMTMFAGVVTSQSATAGQYLYTSTNGGTSWQKTSLSIPGGVRALAFDPSKHATLYAGGGDYKSDLRPRQQRRRLVEVERRRRDLHAHLGRQRRARRRSAARHRRRRRRRQAHLGVGRQGSTAPAAPTVTSSRASTAAPPGPRSRRRAASPRSPTRRPKGSWRMLRRPPT